MSLTNKPLREVSEMFKKRHVTAIEILDEYLNVALKGSCITFCNELSFESAKALDTEFNRLQSPITALPFSLKDNICTKGVLTTCNSRILKANKPDFNAIIAEKLLSGGGILTAKNCMREFSVGRLEDSAYELRNYLVWAGTNVNVNIGAYSIGTDLGMAEIYCGSWVLKLSDVSTNGIITGAPSLEKPTLITRRADDLYFLLQYLNGNKATDKFNKITPKEFKILIYNDLNTAGHLINLFENRGFETEFSKCVFLNKCEIIYDVVLCTEFYTHLQKIGKPENEENKWLNEEYIRNRTNGIGFEAKLNIVKGSHLLSERHIEKTQSIIELKSDLVNSINACLDTYDFIVSPVIYGDRLSKASALAGLAELTVPFGDVLPFKIITRPEKQRYLLEMALYLEEHL